MSLALCAAKGRAQDLAGRRRSRNRQFFPASKGSAANLKAADHVAVAAIVEPQDSELDHLLAEAERAYEDMCRFGSPSLEAW